MTHEDIQQLAALNAINAASADEVAELQRHLETCSDCRRAANELGEAAALIALSVDAVPPPPEVRESILREIRRSDRVPTLEKQMPLATSATRWWLSAAAVLLLGSWGWTALQLRDAREQQRELAGEIARLENDRAKLSATLAALSASGTRTIQLAGQAVAPSASARVFLEPSQRRAFVFFAGLPANPQDKSYQLWIIRADQPKPQSAGVFSVDRGGNASLVVENLPVETAIKALAVTLEPKGGVTTPTGEKYLVGM
jgi:anti-sigma-K factor RskA